MKRLIAYGTLTAVTLVALAGSVVRLANPPAAAAQGVDCTQWSCSPGYDFICSDHNASCKKCGANKVFCAVAQ
jgi:hypothetical protein